MSEVVLQLADCTRDVADHVGGKAVGLGHLLQQDLEVPPGFVVTTEAYRDWLLDHGFAAELERLLTGADDAASQETASRRVAALFEAADPPAPLVADIARAYAQLG